MGLSLLIWIMQIRRGWWLWEAVDRSGSSGTVATVRIFGHQSLGSRLNSGGVGLDDFAD